MENASKALIIAGAILLSILLISLGIMIYSQAEGVVNNDSMSEADITTFNQKFQKYEGTQKGSVAKSLVNEIIATNAHLDETEKIYVKFATDDDATKDTPKTSQVEVKKSYTITTNTTRTGAPTTGKVLEVSIIPVTGTTNP